MSCETGDLCSGETVERFGDQTKCVTAEEIAPTRIPRTTGSFRLRRRLASGQTGVVWLARDTMRRQPVALKFPRSAAWQTTLQNEACCLAQLRHPGVVEMLGWHSASTCSYLSMPFVSELPLSAWLTDHTPLPLPLAVRWVRQIAEAVSHCHEQGWLHRDLKPANILITPDDRPVLIDFGLASRLGEWPGVGERLLRAGSPGYMAPELLTGSPDALSPALDVFSFGVIFYELITGESPFGRTVTTYVNRVLRNDTPRPSNIRPDLPPQVDALCMRMLARDRDERFATMHETAAALTMLARRMGCG